MTERSVKGYRFLSINAANEGLETLHIGKLPLGKGGQLIFP